ncbi:MAG: chaperone NapD [Desulfurivibrionaceae bacterium]
MPIGGFVIQVDPEAKEAAFDHLNAIPEMAIQGSSEDGQVVAVIETSKIEDMERIVNTISTDDYIFHVGLTYINTEDEVIPA